MSLASRVTLLSQRVAAEIKAVRAELAVRATPPGIIEPFGGIDIPAGWLKCEGQSLARSAYPDLFSALTKLLVGSTTNGSTSVTITSGQTQAELQEYVGMPISGSPLGLGAVIVSVAGSVLTLDLPSSATATGAELRVVPHGYAGGTTFNLPNLKTRVPVGRDTTDTAFDRLGETGGEKAVTLSSAQIPAHTHPASSSGGSHAHTAVADGDGGHNHTTRTWGHGLGGGGASAVTRHTASGAAFTYDMPSTTDGAHSHPITVDTSASHSHTIDVSNNTGGGGSHNNLQPYVVLNYIIKT